MASPLTEVVFTRRFHAPREQVWSLWTDPEHVAKWWGPQGFTTSVQQWELRVGGRLQLYLLGKDAKIYSAAGHFREVVAPERLVIAGEDVGGHPCGAGLPPHALLTITLTAHGNHTLLTHHTRFDTPAALVLARQAGYEQGWSSSLETLARQCGMPSADVRL